MGFKFKLILLGLNLFSPCRLYFVDYCAIAFAVFYVLHLFYWTFVISQAPSFGRFLVFFRLSLACGQLLYTRYYQDLLSSESVPMTISSQNMVQQMSKQLCVVSEITESLTLRLLALEERVNALTDRLESVVSESVDFAESFSYLSENSERLVQLRELLYEHADVEQRDSSSTLQVVIDTKLDVAEDDGEEEDDSSGQTAFIESPQALPSELMDQGVDENVDLLSA